MSSDWLEALEQLRDGAPAEPAERRRLANIIRDHVDELERRAGRATRKLATVVADVMKPATRPLEVWVDLTDARGAGVVFFRTDESESERLAEFVSKDGSRVLCIRPVKQRPKRGAWSLVRLFELDPSYELEAGDVHLQDVWPRAFEEGNTYSDVGPIQVSVWSRVVVPGEGHAPKAPTGELPPLPSSELTEWAPDLHPFAFSYPFVRIGDEARVLDRDNVAQWGKVVAVTPLSVRVDLEKADRLVDYSEIVRLRRRGGQ